jgi:outer membrane receptor for ferrienterochelin and colicins
MSLNKNYIAIFFALLLSFLGFSQSTEKKQDSLRSEQLDEIVVTATRTLRQLSSLPMPVQLVSKADIKQSNSLRLADILNEQTGLITIPDFGGGEGIQMQGLDSQYTLILIDGVPLVGRSAGTLDLNRVTVGNIKQIEIVKGASSSLYGSEALGGVINIITDTPKYGLRGEANLRSGSFGTTDLGLSVSQRKDKLGLSFFINRFSSNGFDFDESTPVPNVNPYANYTFDTKVTYEFSDQLNMVFAGRYFLQNQDNLAQDGTTLELFSGESQIDEWNTRLTTTYEVNDNFETIFEFYATQYKTAEFLTDSNGNLFSENGFDQQFIRPELRSTWTKGENKLTTGLGLTHETLERTFFSNKPIFNAPFVFAQYDWNPNDDLNILFGARYDEHNQYQSQFNPKLAINYEFSKKLSVKASAGRGFKAPDFRQLFFNFTNSTVGYRVLGYNLVNTTLPDLLAQNQVALREGINLDDFNDDLKPESSYNYNLGLAFKLSKKVKLDLNLFRNDIINLIDTRAVATIFSNGQNIFSYQNVDEVFTQGLEFNIAYRPNDRWRMSMGYQLLYAKDKEAIDAFESGSVINQGGTEIILFEDQYFGLFNRSRHMGNFKVFYNIPKWKLDINLRATYRSRFGLFDSNGNSYLDTFDVFADGYSIIDIAFNKQIFKNYELGFGADNVFNFTDPQNVNNIAGILLYGKLNIQL